MSSHHDDDDDTSNNSNSDDSDDEEVTRFRISSWYLHHDHGRELLEFCAKLRQNVATITCPYHFGRTMVDDRFCFYLRKSLEMNTSLKHLHFAICAGYDVSYRGFQAVAKGIQRSAVECLTVQFHADANEYFFALALRCLHHVYPRAVVQKLRELNIPYEMNNQDMVNLRAAMQDNVSLEKLSLCLARTREVGGHDLFGSISNSSIAHLVLGHVRPHLYQFLFASGILALPSLRSIRIDNDNSRVCHEFNLPRERSDWPGEPMLPPQTALPLQGVSRVEKLWLRECPVNATDALLQDWLVPSAQKMPNLKELTLLNHGLGPSDTEQLLMALGTHPTLEKLHLSLEDWEFPYHPNANVSCGSMVFHHLHNSLVLRELNVHCGYVQPQGLVSLMKTSSLLTLELHDHQIGLEGLTCIANELSASNLVSLRIRFFLPTEDDPNSINAKAQAKKCEAVADAFAAALKSNKRIQELNASDRRVLCARHKEIDLYVKINKFGHKMLLLPENEQVPVGLWAHVLAKHGRDDEDYVFYFLREQPAALIPARTGKKRTHQCIEERLKREQERKIEML